MRKRVAILMLLTAAVGWLGVGACLESDDGGGEAHVRVVVQGAGQADNVIDIVLWAHPTGTSYTFDLYGEALVAEADFTLDVTYTGDADPTHTVDFSLPIDDVDALVGETGEGHRVCLINPGQNFCPIDFYWSGYVPPNGHTEVDLNFFHPPRILAWSVTPGSGVPAATDVQVQAEVEFYGLDLAVEPTVTAQFWDTTATPPEPLGVPKYLSFVDPAWIGKLPAQFGAEELRLTAVDEDGTTESIAPYPVGP